MALFPLRRTWSRALLVTAVAACVPAAASGARLLYVNTGALIEVLDVDGGASRKAIPIALPGEGAVSASADLAVAGGRLYAVARRPGTMVLLAVDPERNAIVDTIDLVVDSGDPAVGVRRFALGAFLRAGDDGSLHLLMSDAAFPGTVDFLVAVDPARRTVTAVRSPVQRPSDPVCLPFVCSDQPPCLCEFITALAIAPGRRAWAIRSGISPASGAPTLIGIDLATGALTGQVALPTTEQPAFFFPTQLAISPEGATAFVLRGDAATAVDLRTLQIVNSVSFSEPLFPFVLAADGQALYALTSAGGFPPGSSTPSAVVLDARPPFTFERLRSLPLPPAAGFSPFPFLAVSPDGTRVAQVAIRFRFKRRLAVESARAVTIDGADGRAVSDIELTSAALSTGLSLNGLVFIDACADPARCYCAGDGDCGGNFCKDGRCAGAEGCLYEKDPCFDGALCVLDAAATTTTTTPLTTTTTLIFTPPPADCSKVTERLGRLAGIVRERLVAASILGPETPAEYRRAARRAQAAVAKRLRAELSLALNPRPLPLPEFPGLERPPRGLRGFYTTRQCIGRDLGTYLDISERLQRVSRNPNLCAAGAP